MKRQYIGTKDHVQIPASTVREHYEPQLSGAVYGYEDAGPFPAESEQCWDSITHQCQPVSGNVACDLDKSGLCSQDESAGTQLAGVS